MTCIVGYRNNGKVYLGGDSLGSNGWNKATYLQDKVFENKYTKGLIFGISGTYNFQCLEYEKLISDTDIANGFKFNKEFIITKFIPKLKEVLKKYNSNFNQNSIDTSEGVLIVGYEDKLFTIQSDYSMLEPKDDYIACGSGEYFAIGSLYSTMSNSESVIDKIKLALKSAEKYAVGVEAPFKIIDTEGNIY